ncbi:MULTISPECIES: formimidoylglutamase [unclassified Natrinema]|uniref:formimidoylglutamase n=1 Tax=unclassified Natrinema TaxID=2622230 RepID=UPI00026D4C15|nr:MULTISPECIES: formimidoylglutamase [unclassified Natrinema]AFO59322.1 formiminoglutamase [Natrinema sp. J7-2]
MSSFIDPPTWSGPSSDPADEQFGDVVTATTLEEADAFDAVLVGEPYDGAVISRAGAAAGPRALRESLSGVKTHHFGSGPVRSVADLGDVPIPDGSVADVQRAVRERAAAIHEREALPVFLGGDNSLTYSNVAPLLGDASVGVVNIDAHLDVRETRDGPTSGTPYRQLHEAGLDGYACLGARHFETSTAYHEFVREHGGAVITATETAADPAGAVERALAALEDVDRLYCSVDIDVLDAPYCGVSAPTPGGLLPREVFDIVGRLAADDRLAGFEVVECAPPLDENGRTVDAAARTVAHALTGWAA